MYVLFTNKFTYCPDGLPVMQVLLYSITTNKGSYMTGIIDTGSFPHKIHTVAGQEFFETMSDNPNENILVLGFNEQNGFANSFSILPQNKYIDKFLTKNDCLAIYSPQILSSHKNSYCVIDFISGNITGVAGSADDIKNYIDKSYGDYANKQDLTFSSAYVDRLPLKNSEHNGTMLVVDVQFDGITKPTLIDTGLLQSVYTNKNIKSVTPSSFNTINFASNQFQVAGEKDVTVEMKGINFGKQNVLIGGEDLQKTSLVELASEDKQNCILGASFFKSNNTILAIPFWKSNQPLIIGRFQK